MVVPKLIKKFNELTNDRFSYLRPSSTELYAAQKKLKINFIYSQKYADDFEQNKAEIQSTIISIFSLEQIEVIPHFAVSHFDRVHFIIDVMNFFSNYPSLYSLINADNIIIEEKSDFIKVEISLSEPFYDYIINSKIDKKLDEFIYYNYCDKINTSFSSFSMDDDELYDDNLSQKSSDANALRRTIICQDVEKYVGKPVGDTASYIIDINAPRAYSVLCGRVKNFKKIEKKVKKDEPHKDFFFKFNLEDFTGKIETVVFPSKYSFQRLCDLGEDTEIICDGEIKKDVYGGNERFVFMPRNISLCRLPKNFELVSLKPFPTQYSLITPKPYKNLDQFCFFSSGQSYRNSDFFCNNTYVVFDLETTGISAENERIIEIGAVKIEKGVIVEEFSTFVNPERPISARITELTSITDADVANAPKIEDVIADFILFCKDAVLVAHNTNFDYSFISKAGKDSGYIFNNAKLDTIAIAKKHVREIRSFNLNSLTKHFGIINERAHRAIYDARATAELLFALVDRARGAI